MAKRRSATVKSREKAKKIPGRPRENFDNMKKSAVESGKKISQSVKSRAKGFQDKLKSHPTMRKAVAPTVIAAAALAVGGTVAAIQSQKHKKNGRKTKGRSRTVAESVPGSAVHTASRASRRPKRSS